MQKKNLTEETTFAFQMAPYSLYSALLMTNIVVLQDTSWIPPFSVVMVVFHGIMNTSFIR
jgi:hypothetical protein